MPEPSRFAPRGFRNRRDGQSHTPILAELMATNDEVERRAVAPTTNEADLSQSSTSPWFTGDTTPAIARTDC